MNELFPNTRLLCDMSVLHSELSRAAEAAAQAISELWWIRGTPAQKDAIHSIITKHLALDDLRALLEE